MNRIFKPSDIVSYAFSSEELVHKGVITMCDIVEVGERYLRPILGDNLIEAIATGQYPELKTNYILPAVAAWCRYVVEPLIASRCSLCDDLSSADNERLAMIMPHLRNKASALTRRLSRYLDAHGDMFSEYNPKSNPLNRCSIYGSIIQIH
ncbi:MAG: hypothetical protein IIX19_00695 [Alistipes sp.]|nr:hypothetical protein [Alistipes sp.]